MHLASLLRGLAQGRLGPMNVRRIAWEFIDGCPVPLRELGAARPDERDRRQFLEYPPGLCTGNADSQFVGQQLLYLAAQDDEWHAIPWRMLHNRYVRPGWRDRYRHRDRSTVPSLGVGDGKVIGAVQAETPEVRLAQLLNGMRHLLANGLVTVATLEQEDFVCVTPALIRCAVTQERPMTPERERDPLGLRSN